MWSNDTLPYSGSLHPNGNIKLAELFGREDTNETDIYTGLYDFGAGAVDVNFDGQINIIDVTLVAKAFSARAGNVNWDLDADLDGSGIINIIDVTKVAVEFQKTFSSRIHCRRIVVSRSSSLVSAKSEASESVNSSLLSPYSLSSLAACIVLPIAYFKRRRKHMQYFAFP